MIFLSLLFVGFVIFQLIPDHISIVEFNKEDNDEEMSCYEVHHADAPLEGMVHDQHGG